jgi:hypothetical protein
MRWAATGELASLGMSTAMQRALDVALRRELSQMGGFLQKSLTL